MPDRFAKSVVVVFAVMALLAGAAPETPKDFTVFDNMAYKDKPDLAAQGLVHCNIIYGGSAEAKGAKRGVLPNEQGFKKRVVSASAVPGPIVIDIEDLDLKGDPADVEANFTVFTTLVQWAHEAAPGRVVGYYGHGLFPNPPDKKYAAETKKLAEAVDAFFPSMYTSNDDRAGWKSKLEALVKQAHALGPGKPVYPYLWPQYHEGSSKALQFIDGDYWAYQLQTARDCGCDGVVLWSSRKYPWNVDAPWWRATVKFAGTLRGDAAAKAAG